MLQGEVTRTYREPTKAASRRVIPNFWPRLILGSATVAVVLLMAGLWLRYDQQQQLALDRESASKLSLFPQSAPAGAPPSPALPGAAPEAFRDFELAAAGPEADKQAAGRGASPVPATPPAAAAAEVVHVLKREDTVRNAAEPQLASAAKGNTLSETLGEGLQLSSARAVSAPLPTPTLARSEARQFAPSQRKTGSATDQATPMAIPLSSAVTIQFQQLGNRHRPNLNSPPPMPVLTNFQMQRDGNIIRFVDADGSVYSGVVQALSAGNGTSGIGPANSSLAEQQTATQNAIAPLVRDDAALAPFSFRTVGTNRSLKQVVVFTGEYVPSATSNVSNQLANSADNAAPAVESAGQLSQLRAAGGRSMRAKTLTPQAQQMPTNRLLMPGRIEGRAAVGAKDALRIEAQQVGP
jgi:hypothetical protein